VRRWKLVVTVVLVLAGLVALPTGPASAAIAYPTVMASAGDSITRAYDATLFGCFLSDCTQYSWSTGTSSSVNSEYRRVHAANAAATASNDAKTGAKMADLAAQLGTAATQGAQYVTVLMGANDVCTKTIATMTPTATFQASFDAALHQFFAARPDAHVFVGSIPDVYQLWSLLHTNSAARSTWSTFGICQSMLASSNTEAQRQQVVAQEQADNAALATVCATYAGCLWDGLAINHYAFTTPDVSTVDYFHPSVSGQNTLAGIAWNAGYWGA
jgi:lysophospholipase L1-like esterase